MSRPDPVKAKVVPKYQSIRSIATNHQKEAERLMQIGQYKEAGLLFDKAILLLNTVPTKHRTAELSEVVLDINFGEDETPAKHIPSSTAPRKRDSFVQLQPALDDSGHQPSS